MNVTSIEMLMQIVLWEHLEINYNVETIKLYKLKIFIYLSEKDEKDGHLMGSHIPKVAGKTFIYPSITPPEASYQIAEPFMS